MSAMNYNDCHTHAHTDERELCCGQREEQEGGREEGREGEGEKGGPKHYTSLPPSYPTLCQLANMELNMEFGNRTKGTTN